MDEIRVLCPNGMIGYGFPEESLEEGLRRTPDIIAADAGSTDPGPHYLGAGISFTSREAVKRDVDLLLLGRDRKKIPLVIGSAGGAGAKPHLEWVIDIIKEIAKEKGLRFKLARIEADIDKNFLKREFQKGKIKTFESMKELTIEEIDRSERIVAQMGLEPIIEALTLGADVIIAGRAYDPAMLAALPVMRGFDKGLAIHMAKILECGCQAAEPLSPSDVIMGTVRKDHFLVEPMNEIRRCTKISVAAHTLYEKDNPLKLLLPGGALDLTGVRFEEVNNRVVKVSGSKFIQDDVYKLKLEGASRVGYRSIFIAGVRDPIMIEYIDEVVSFVRNNFNIGLKHIRHEDYQMLFHIYGKNGVMGNQESYQGKSHELGIVGEVVAKTQEIAKSICAFARASMLHYDYTGRKATGGNLAFLYSPSDIQMGEVFQFNVYHLLEVDNPLTLFPITMENI